MRITCSIFICFICLSGPLLSAVDYKESDNARIQSVAAFVSNVLKDAADRYHTPATPLLADGVHLVTKEQLKWRFADGTESVISSLSCQQNFFRVLVAMSALTGDPRYEKVARDNIAYYFANYQEPSGLLQWGSHRFIDLKSLKVVGPLNKSLMHEIKSVLPFYELMYEVDAKATEHLVTGIWRQHVLTENGLMFDRHNAYEKSGSFCWDGVKDCEDEAFRERVGLTFITTGDDLVYSAAMLGVLSKDPRPWQWGCRLAGLYQKARDPNTHLGVYQFSNVKKLEDESTARSPERRYMSKYGDRAARQIGTLDGFEVTEKSLLFVGQAHAVYAKHSLMQLHLASLKQEESTPYIDWTTTGLKAFAKYAYVPDSNHFKPLLTNGRDMTGYKLLRDGYFGKSGTEIGQQYQATGDFLLAYVRAYCAASDAELWSVIRSMAKGLGVGDVGDGAGNEIAIDVKRSCEDPAILFALIDLYKKTGSTEYLEGARIVGDNITADKFRSGFFVNSRSAKYANIDAIEPLALLALEAAIRGKSVLVPEYIGSTGFIHGEYLSKTGKLRNIVDKALYITVDNEVGISK